MKAFFRSPSGYIAIIFILLTLVVYTAGLFISVTRDGSKYATIAREVYETGDWINLKVHGEPYDQKPPMTFWLAALSFHVFGLSNFAFKLSFLLLALFGVYSTYRLGQSMYGKRTGILAAALFATSEVFFLYYMDIHTDSVMMPFVAFALWQLYDFIKKKRTLNCMLGFASIGLAMLCKGPVGAVVPGFAVLGHLVFTKQFKRFADIRWYIGIVLAFAFTLPALSGLYNQFGMEGIRFYYWTNNFGRMQGELGAMRNDYSYFAVILLYLFIPWMLSLFSSIFFNFKWLIKHRFHAREFFLFSGIWFYFIVLTISKGKLPNYILSIVPFFSILTAKYLALALSLKKEKLYRYFLWLQNVVAILLGIATVVFITWLFPVKNLLLWAVFVLMQALALFSTRKQNPKFVRLLYPSMAASITLSFFINVHIAPQIFSDQASVKAAGIVNERANDDDKIYNYNYSSYELYFYSKIPVEPLENDVSVIKKLKEPGNWIFTDKKVVERLQGDYPPPEVIPLRHVWVNKLSSKYINPKTRESKRDTLYLLHSTAE